MKPAKPGELVVRRWTDEDSISELTQLLHRAYAELAAMGLRFVATYQSDAITRDRVYDGECYVVEEQGKLIATITYYPPEATDGFPWYDRADVAMFGQFAVDLEYRSQGIGQQLLNIVETLARETGVRELALDTAEPAEHLIRYYMRLGYRYIETIHWPNANYDSVVLSKTLAE